MSPVGMKNPKRRPDPLKAEIAGEWRAEVIAPGVCFFADLFDHECSFGPPNFTWDPCHLIPAQTLKAHYSTYPSEEKWRAVYDKDLAVCGCRTAHQLSEFGSMRGVVALEDLPPRSVERAKEIGLDWKLELEFPPRPAQQSHNRRREQCH